MKRRASKTPNRLPFEEWYFGQLEEVELAAAFQYEIARSSKRVHDYVAALHAFKVEGRTLKEMILGDNPGDDDKAFELLCHGQIGSEFASHDINFFAYSNPLFPAPWNMLLPEDRVEIAKENAKSVPTGLHVIPASREGADAWLQRFGKDVSGKYATAIVTLNLTRVTPKDVLLATFGKWIDSVRLGKKPKRGRGGRMPPWHKLRALAAYRLSANGDSFGEAQKTVDELKRDKRFVGDANLTRALPEYGDQSDWHAAVRSTRAELARLEQAWWVE